MGWRQAEIVEFLEDFVKIDEEAKGRFKELYDEVWTEGGCIRLALVKRGSDVEAALITVHSAEELEKALREHIATFKPVGIRVERPNNEVEWLDLKLRPLPSEPEEFAKRWPRPAH